MAVFEFEAIGPGGQKKRSTIEAANQAEAIKQLRSRGMKPTKIRESKKAAAGGSASGGKKKKMGGGLFGGGVSQADLVQFTQQLATLQDAGLPIVRSLKILADQMNPGVFQNQLNQVTEDVEGGSTLSEALEKYPKTFDTLFVAMVKAGEAGGVLDTILQRLSDFQEKSMKLRKKVQGALVYPVAVICVAALILGFIMTQVIPQFQKMFADMNTALPGPTQALLGFAEAVQGYWWAAPLIIMAMITALKALGRTNAGELMIDKSKLNAPIFGQIVKKSTVSRFCRTLGTLISSENAKDLNTAYEMAVYADPELRQEQVKAMAAAQSQDNVKTEAVKKAKKAARSKVRGSATPAAPALPANASIRDTINASIRQLENGRS